jgi:hypothetical protein
MAIFAVCLATPLGAQTVVTEPVLDPVQVELRDELYRLRDTLTLVEGATALIARDLRSSSDQLLRSRAKAVSERCMVAASVVPPARVLVTERARPMPDVRKSRAHLISALEELEVKLTQCTTEFAGLATPDRSQELRDYGIGRGAKLREAVRAFDTALGLYFANAIGTRYMPKAGRSAGLIP